MSTYVLRGTVRAALAIALGWPTMPRPASADMTLIIGKASATADTVIAANVGDQLGFFKKHGIDLTIVDFTGGSKMIQAMAAGSIDIADGAGTEMAFTAKGVPMLAVCESAMTLPYFSIGVPWDSPIKSKEELKGKKIGVSSAGSLTDWLAKELARKEGWPPDAITTVTIGSGSSSSNAAFREHLIDAYIGGTTTFLAMAEKKIGRVLLPVSDYEGSIASGTLFASNHLIADRPRCAPRVPCRLARHHRLHPYAQRRDGEDREWRQRLFGKRHVAGIRYREQHVHQGLQIRRGIAR